MENNERLDYWMELFAVSSAGQISEEQYNALKEKHKEDPVFTKFFDEWEKLSEEAIQEGHSTDGWLTIKSGNDDK